MRNHWRPGPAEVRLRQHAVQGKILLVADAVLSGEPHLAGLPILGDRAEMRHQDNRGPVVVIAVLLRALLARCER